MSARMLKTEKSRTGTKVRRTRKLQKVAALNVFNGKSLDTVTVEEITEKINFVSQLMDFTIRQRFACAAAEFVYGFFSFAMIGMTCEQIETSVEPLRRVFVESLRTFVGQ
jgi:hypothetical protein